MKRLLPPLLLTAMLLAGSAAQGNPPENETAVAPQNRHQADERERQGRPRELPRLPAPDRAEAGAINPATGQYYPPAGNGDVINPSTGERYLGTPGGYINPSTGELMPRVP